MLHFQAVLLVALILGTSVPFTQAGPYGVNMENSICCKDFVRFPLPLKLLTNFHFSSNTCRRQGVILTTVKGREICADPQKPWVKHILKRLLEKN